MVKFFHRKAKFLSEESKKKIFLDSWVKFRRLEVREQVRNVFVTSLRLSDHKVFRIGSHQVFLISLRFARFFRSHFVLSKLLEFKGI